MKQVYLLYKFNPYHNRRIVKYSTITEYISNPNHEAGHIYAASYLSCANPKNFAYRDGVDTVMTVTLSNALETPDYALIIEQTNQTIESRWFVMDSDLKSGATTTLTLHRDMIADYYEDVLTAPCFIEKATLNPADPFIFNTENITVNRIKKGETLIKDKSKCAWVVGYLATNAITTPTEVESLAARDVYAVFADSTEFNTWTYKDYVGFGVNTESLPSTPAQYEKEITSASVMFAITKTDYLNISDVSPYGIVNYGISKKGTITLGHNATYKTITAMQSDVIASTYGVTSAPFKISGLGIWSSFFNNKIKNSLSAKASQFIGGCSSYFNVPENTTIINAYDGINIKIGEKYYKLTKTAKSGIQPGNSANFGTSASNDIVNAIKGMSCWDSVDSVATNTCINASISTKEFYLKAEEITSAEFKINLLATERVCGRLPYKMFCIPYSTDGNITIKIGSNPNDTIIMTQDLAISVAKAMSAKFTGTNSLFDIQLLPYCPDQNIIVNDHIIQIPNSTSTTSFITDGDENNPQNIGAIYWCAENTGTFNISHAISVNNVKMDSITEMYRLASPNWNGQFEFNPAKNGGVQYLNVDYTYKPHMPYIHINPNFGRLYGEDFDDARGLICAGDFSLPQTSDAWNNYEIQNKNYQLQFQRDIESLELTQSIEMKKQKFQSGVGVLSGAMSGAAAGAMVGGIGGGVAGAIGGAALSGVGAAMDIKYQKQLNEEAIDYRQDQFGFQLENIKALPQNLTNVGGMTANNKIWPVIEHYSCTDEEKQALEMKLYYNGMTVERIGTMADFLQDDYSYIKGKLIRLTINEDNHFIEMIANEINRGVFIK